MKPTGGVDGRPVRPVLGRPTPCDPGSFVVTTDDGVIFSCIRAPLGFGSERRWILRDSRSRRYVGPPAESDCSPWAVQGLIARWWRSRHDDGQVIRLRATSHDSSDGMAPWSRSESRATRSCVTSRYRGRLRPIDAPPLDTIRRLWDRATAYGSFAGLNRSAARRTCR